MGIGNWGDTALGRQCPTFSKCRRFSRLVVTAVIGREYSLLPYSLFLISYFLFPISYSLNLMSITVTGKIERRQLGMGTWALISDEGVTYEILKGADKELLKAGQKAKVTGQVREDIMTIAMIGPVLEVKSFEVLSSD